MTEGSEITQDERMSWWREAKFGMFIHWGLYALPAGVWKGERISGIGEWIMQKAQIPISEYEKLAGRFNPTEFDAEEWVRLAKRAGMKWMIITAKHHDGFCLFDTDQTDYNIVDATPFGRDPLEELAQACQKEGIKFGFYYSQTLDWHHPHGAGNDWDFDPNEKNFTDYFRNYVEPQLEELLTNYGPIGAIWFDIGTPTPELARELKGHVRELQPETIVSGRIDPFGRWETGIGDYQSRGDNEIPEGLVEGDWETPATMNDTWGYKSYDQNWKSTGDLLGKLVDITHKGGNYLLNVGPTAKGEIPEPSVERLEKMGAWLEKNGESVYGTTPSSIPDQYWGVATEKGEKTYLHVFAWPGEGELRVRGVGEVKEAQLLAGGESLEVTEEGEELTIATPEEAPDPIDTVIALR